MNAIKMGMTIEEAAETSGIGRNTMRKLVDWGKLPVLKVGRKTIIRRDTLERFMTVNQGRNLLCQDDVRKVRVNRSQSPRRLSGNTPLAQIYDLFKRYFALAGEPVSQLVGIHRRYDTEKIATANFHWLSRQHLPPKQPQPTSRLQNGTHLLQYRTERR